MPLLSQLVPETGQTTGLAGFEPATSRLQSR